MMDRIKWSLIGIPDHDGVVHVGGRVGAAGGPAAFRSVFARFRGRDRVRETCLVDVDLSGSHEEVASSIAQAQLNQPLSVVVGGGNDHSYSQLLGVAEALSKSGGRGRIGCINVDAHFDVRQPNPDINSGSPFYVAIERGVLDPRRFVEFGIQRHCNSPELWDYVEARRIEVVPFEKLRHGRAGALFKRTLDRLARACEAVVVSLDLDSVAQAYAPGVSAPQAEGLSSSDLLEIAALSGRHPKVASLGIFELNPEHDIDQRTARLAATAAWHFVAEAQGRRG
jgi:formiminoglutamase